MTYFEQLRWSLRAYEYQRTIDLVLLPWHLLRWLWFYLVTQVWGWYRYLCHRPQFRPLLWSFMWGRHESLEPILCHYCLWAGSVRSCSHGYAACGDDDVEPCDYCPRCDGEI